MWYTHAPLIRVDSVCFPQTWLIARQKTSALREIPLLPLEVPTIIHQSLHQPLLSPSSPSMSIKTVQLPFPGCFCTMSHPPSALPEQCFWLWVGEPWYGTLFLGPVVRPSTLGPCITATLSSSHLLLWLIANSCAHCHHHCLCPCPDHCSSLWASWKNSFQPMGCHNFCQCALPCKVRHHYTSHAHHPPRMTCRSLIGCLAIASWLWMLLHPPSGSTDTMWSWHLGSCQSTELQAIGTAGGHTVLPPGCYISLPAAMVHPRCHHCLWSLSIEVCYFPPYPLTWMSNRTLVIKPWVTVGCVPSYSHRPYHCWHADIQHCSSPLPLPLKPAHWQAAFPSLSTDMGGWLVFSGACILRGASFSSLSPNMNEKRHWAMDTCDQNPERLWGAFFHSLMDPITDSLITHRHPALFLALNSHHHHCLWSPSIGTQHCPLYPLAWVSDSSSVGCLLRCIISLPICQHRHVMGTRQMDGMRWWDMLRHTKTK